MAGLSLLFNRTIRLQLAALGVVLALMVLIVAALYGIDRDNEWRLRDEQAAHRLELGFALISRDLSRVRADVEYLASQLQRVPFDPQDEGCRAAVEAEFRRLLQFKSTFQQLRLIDRHGQEQVRVQSMGGNIVAVSKSDLQNKLDRYYVQDSLRLEPGEIFVSEFDLNQEYGKIDRPLNPVIRFVTPLADPSHEFLLVVNYRGSSLLDELSSISLPGETLLVRGDGQYLLADQKQHEWGWLLGHDDSMVNQYPQAWDRGRRSGSLTRFSGEGAFAFKEIELNQDASLQSELDVDARSILLVSHLKAEQVFARSNQLLGRLLVFLLVASLPLLLLTRLWAVGQSRREEQNLQIRESEKRLRELSARLVKIQEEERKVISRELHDELGQQVTAINLDLKLARRETDVVRLQPRLERAVLVGEQLLETIHDFATRVRPAELDDLGIHDAIDSHVDVFQQRTGIQVKFRSNVQAVKLRPEVAENVFRLVQESLNNVLKHSGASAAEVSIMLLAGQATSENGQTDSQLQVCVCDNGNESAGRENAGRENVASSGEPKSGLGIIGMRERVELMGGTINFEIDSLQGTAVEVHIPSPVFPT